MLRELRRRLWQEGVGLMFRRPRTLQVAALRRRDGPEGQEILMVTSKSTRRWLLPKGWPERTGNAARTALTEAWEEAGLEGATALEPAMGEYQGVKRHDGGLIEPCRVLVYELVGGRLADDYPEAGQRTRRWVPVAEAAALVEEPALRDFLAGLDARSGSES